MASFARRLSSLTFVVALVLASTACARHYRVISRSGPPSELAGLSQVHVQYDDSHVALDGAPMSEGEDSANIGFIEGLQQGLGGATITEGQAPAGGIQVTVRYMAWDEGMYAADVARPSAITARVIFSRDGTTLDEIEVETKEDATMTAPTPEQRLHTCGQRLGQFTAEYVRDAGG